MNRNFISYYFNARSTQEAFYEHLFIFSGKIKQVSWQHLEDFINYSYVFSL
jgi:hypothetical protein